MTEQANPPTLFTTPTDRPSLDREVLASLHESKTPLDIDAIHDEVNADKGKSHVAKGPLETLLGELTKAGKIAEVAHGQPARPHFVLVAEVREQLDGTWTRAKALAAIVVAMGEPTNPVTIQDITGTLGEALMRVEGSLPIPLPLLSAIASCVDVNNPEAVDAMVAVQLDALVRNGLAVMNTPAEPGPFTGTMPISMEDTTPVDTSARGIAEADESATAKSDESTATEAVSEPNLHANTFALTVMGWEKLVEEGALAVAIVAFPEIGEHKNDSLTNEVRELKRKFDEMKREYDINKGVAESRINNLLSENKQLRTEQGRFLAFCQDKGIDFALAASGNSNERVRERHTIRGILTVEKLSELIGEKTKAARYAAALSESVKNQTALGKASVKDAEARVEQLDSVIAMAENGIGSEFSVEKMCIKYVQGGCIVWKSDEPHDQGRTVEVKPITGDDGEKKEEGGEKKKEKPTQLAIPGTARPGDIEWQPGDPPPVGSGESEAVVGAAEPAKELADANEPTPTTTEAITVEVDDDEAGDVPEDANDNIDDGDDEDEEDGAEDEEEEGEEGDEEAPPSSPSSSDAPIVNGKSVPDSVSAKAFIRNQLVGGRATIKDLGIGYAKSIGCEGKHRVVGFGEDIVKQLVDGGELESEIVGDSVFVWLKGENPAKPGKSGRGRKSK